MEKWCKLGMPCLIRCVYALYVCMYMHTHICMYRVEFDDGEVVQARHAMFDKVCGCALDVCVSVYIYIHTYTHVYIQWSADSHVCTTE